nr:ArsA-related P-loop ATPase [Escherichia coli]
MISLSPPTICNSAKVIIVTLAETTPVLEATNLQQDLRRAGIEPWAWVVNNSLAAAQPSSPFLKIRANRELPLISDVEEQYAKRIALTALQSEEPVGIDLLEDMAK